MSLHVNPDTGEEESMLAEMFRQEVRPKDYSSQLLLTALYLCWMYLHRFIDLCLERVYMSMCVCVYREGIQAGAVCIFNLRARVSVCALRHSDLATGWL